MIEKCSFDIDPCTPEPVLTEEERIALERRKQDNLLWLKEHFSWRPFGAEW